MEGQTSSHTEYSGIARSLWEHAKIGLCIVPSHTGILPFSCSTCRYPTNKWVKLGTFHARDERIVQSFPLDEQLYAKYVKVLLFFLPPAITVHLCLKERNNKQLIHSFSVQFLVNKYTQAHSYTWVTAVL